MNKDLRERVRAFFEAQIGASVVWTGQPAPFVGAEHVIVFLGSSASRSVGADETRRSFVAGPPEGYVEEQVGWRSITLSLRCECYDQDFEALDVLEDLRSDLILTRVRQELAFEDVAVESVGEVHDLDNDVDTRAVSTASVDIRLAWQKVSRDQKEAAPYFDRVDITSGVTS